MVEDSENFAEMDKKLKQQTEAKMELEKLAYTLREGEITISRLPTNTF